MGKKGQNKNPHFWDINRIPIAANIQNIPRKRPSLFYEKDVRQVSPHLLRKVCELLSLP